MLSVVYGFFFLYCSGRLPWLVTAAVAYAVLRPSLGHHHCTDVFQLVLLHSAYLAAYLHGHSAAL